MFLGRAAGAATLRRVYPLHLLRTRSVLFSGVPYKVVRFQPTPNPNAVKCILDGSLPEPIRSYRTAAEAAADPLGRALFQIPGVTGILISGGWVTVSKSDAAPWPAIQSGVQAVLSKA